ncbi:PadR family transcriptional regulator [Asanoa sp. WMMD1127]|uniref:PadR family transcriptional regulator n=1 Tax=Asanoa sp. WMMD1127 TaxID=3016107 RepID=UPI002417DDA4|nr:PadR family transcriptional regulator [Asanoa sp. WMMD1127]MDG4827421.1 PadR family transcriptional regulator [Asanoa sp. WMMD1127]
MVGEKLELELRRGVVALAVLSQLGEFRYGYELRQSLTDKGLPIEEGTLYPLLRRLESQGVLSSEWRTDGQPRRYYRLSPAGQELYKRLRDSWSDLNEAVRRLTEGDD